MQRNHLILLLVGVMVGLTGCGGVGSSDPAQGRQLIYSIDFARGNSQWATVKTLLEEGITPENTLECWRSWLGKNACTIIAPVENGNMILESPWWLDNNHAPPGAGFLNLLAYTFMGKPSGPADPSSTLDLTNAMFAISLHAKDIDLKGGQLLFWFQVGPYDGKFTNFVFSGSPIDISSSGGYPVEINLELIADPKMWQCLGSSDSRSDVYGCSISFENAVKKVNNDFGLVIMPTLGDPNPGSQPSGKILVSSIKLFSERTVAK